MEEEFQWKSSLNLMEERGFKTPFCQQLKLQGFLYVISNQTLLTVAGLSLAWSSLSSCLSYLEMKKSLHIML